MVQRLNGLFDIAVFVLSKSDCEVTMISCCDQISYVKVIMHQIRFRLGLRPRPRWGSSQRSPDPIAGF